MTEQSSDLSASSTVDPRASLPARWKWVAAVLIPSVLFDLLVMRQRLPLGVRNEWLWEYQLDRPPLFTLLFPTFGAPLILFVALYAAERFDLKQFGRAATLACLLALAVSAYVFRFLVQWVAVPQNNSSTFAAAVVASDVATSHFTVAKSMVDFRKSLPEYHYWMSRWPKHAQTHPPGTTLAYWLGLRAVTASEALRTRVGRLFYGPDFERSGEIERAKAARMAQATLSMSEFLAATLIAFVLPVFGALSVIPFFYFARRLLGAAWAWRAAVLQTTLPALAVFFYAIDQVYFFLAMLVLATFMAAVDRRSAALGLLGGVVFATALFFSLSLLPLAVFAAVVLVIGLRDATPDRRRVLLRLAGAGLLGAVGFYVLMFGAFRFNMIGTVRSALHAHAEVTLREMPRGYARWLIWNLLDFFFLLGIPGTVAFLLHCVRDETADETAGLEHRWQPVMTSAFIVTLLLLDASGKVRGEVGRIWMFLAPLPLALGCARLMRIQPASWAHVLWVGVACLQLAQTMFLQHSVGTGFMRPW